MINEHAAVGLWWVFGLMLPPVAAVVCAVLWPHGIAWLVLAFVAFVIDVFDASVGPFG